MPSNPSKIRAKRSKCSQPAPPLCAKNFRMHKVDVDSTKNRAKMPPRKEEFLFHSLGGWRRFLKSESSPQPLPDMNKRKRHKTASTKRNEFRLIIIKRLVDKWSNCSDEYKLAFKLLIDEILVDVKKRHIARYHDLIDYLSGKAESRIEHNENLFPEQKNYLKIIVRLKAELIKRWPYIRKPFWPGEKHGRIARR